MSNHINKKELIDFVFSEQAENIDIERIARINKHLYECDECKNNYNRFLELYQILQKMKSNSLQAFTLGAAFSQGKNINLLKDTLNSLKEEVELTVFSNKKIEVLNSVLYGKLNHPYYQNTIIAKSMSSTSRLESQGEKNESILVSNDEKINISIDEDETLSVYYSKEISDENNIIILIEKNKEMIYISNMESYDRNNNVGRFSDLKPGNYVLFKSSI